MKLTFPHMGNIFIVAKAFLDTLKIDYIIPPFITKKTLEIGTSIAPEMACLPLKITLGTLIQAHNMGADTILMTGGHGPCRFGYYCEMQREILKDAGYDMKSMTLEMPDKGFSELIHRMKELSGGYHFFRLIKAAWYATRVSVMVDRLEIQMYKTRATEKTKGETKKIYKAFQDKVLNTKGAREIIKLIKSSSQAFNTVEKDLSYKPLKIGIVGEIYTTNDPHTSFNIQEKLADMGVEVLRKVTVSEWIVEHIIKGGLHLPRNMSFAKAAKPYLPTMIGGHAQETIGNAVLFAQQGFDGVIQIYPLACMPEVVAQSILPQVEKDYGIPILTLIIDEMTGEAGYVTRLEAFVDLLKLRKERKNSSNEWILSGN